jgi:uncharacterized protein
MNKHLLSVLLAISLSTSVLAGFEEGVAAYEAGNLPLAVKEFSAAAEKGDANSQFNVGLMYEQGIGVGKDEKEAVAWYRKAAEQGNSNAQYNLAVLYENGRGTKIDFAKALQWYRKAAIQGDELAVGNLGMLYVRGQGVTKDKVAGLALLLLSVAINDSPQNNAKKNISSLRGVTPDDLTAAQALAEKMRATSDPLIPLDQYLQNAASRTSGKS